MIFNKRVILMSDDFLNSCTSQWLFNLLIFCLSFLFSEKYGKF
ncbi:hypothetical protein M153_8590003893, partial [Pseudoloma neurophilia]